MSRDTITEIFREERLADEQPLAFICAAELLRRMHTQEFFIAFPTHKAGHKTV